MGDKLKELRERSQKRRQLIAQQLGVSNPKYIRKVLSSKDEQEEIEKQKKFTHVMNYPVPEGKTGQQVMELLQRRVEQLGASKMGNYLVDCEMYQSKLSGAQHNQMVYVLHNSEQPASCFAILSSSNRCLVADTPFDILMMKLKDFYQHKKNSKVETKGLRFTLGDFIIKIGSVVIGGTTSFKGILVEVEYTPCVIAQECWGLLREFMQGFLGSCVDKPTNHLSSHMTEVYTPSDTVMQYLEHFNNIRKAAQSQQQQQMQKMQQPGTGATATGVVGQIGGAGQQGSQIVVSSQQQIQSQLGQQLQQAR